MSDAAEGSCPLLPGEGLGPQGGDPRGRRHAIVVDLSTCIARDGPPPSALVELRAAPAARLREHPYEAADALRTAYSKYLGVPAEELVAARGASELVWLLAGSAQRGRLAVPLPAYTEYRDALPERSWGAPAWYHRRDAIAGALARGAVVLLSNPHNPSGRAFSAAELVELCAAHPGGALVVDESYVEFCAEPARYSVVGAPVDNLVALRSPSKFFGLAGARVGVAWSRSPELRNAFSKRRGSWPVSALEAAPVIAALADGAWIGAKRAAVQADSAWLGGVVERLGHAVAGSVTHFRLLPAAAADSVAEALAVRGVAVRVLGRAHGLPGPALRITAPLAGERDVVAAALDAVARLR